MSALNRIARIIGALLLVIVFLAPFSMVYIPTTLIVPNDAAKTASNIMASAGLLRAGMVSDALVFLIEIALTTLLYVLLESVNKTLALMAAFARLAMTVIQGLNLLNYAFALLLLSGASYLAVFSPEQLHALALFFLNAHASVVLIWGLFFGLHLLLLGYLVYRSGYIPKFVGILLLVAALCYFVQDLGTILLPQYEVMFTSIGALSIAEIALPLWLLIKGVQERPA